MTFAEVFIYGVSAGALGGGWVGYHLRDVAGSRSKERPTASGADIREHLSLASARKDMSRIHPEFDWRKVDRHWAALHLGQESRFQGRQFYVKKKDSVLAIGRSQSGKTTFLARAAREEPGAVVLTGTKADIHNLTAAQREAAGHPTLVFNPEGLGGIRSTFKWSPIDGCKSPGVALMRAGYLIQGSPGAKDSTNANFWESNAAELLACLLMAAAVGDHDMWTLKRWVDRPSDRQPLNILREWPKAPQGWVDTLARFPEEMNEKTKQSVYDTLKSVFRFMMDDPKLVDSVLPGRDDDTFDVRDFIRQRGTLYLLGSDRPHSSITPLFTALTGHIFESAKVMATEQDSDLADRGRLNPSLMLCLDEVAQICSVPLTNWLNDSGGRGIQLIMGVQNYADLEAKWGRPQRDAIVAGSSLVLVAAGQLDPQLADLIDKRTTYEVERQRQTRSADGRVTTTTESKVMHPFNAKKMGEMRPGEWLGLYRTAPPFVVKLAHVYGKAKRRPPAERLNVAQPKRKAATPRFGRNVVHVNFDRRASGE